MSMERAAMRGKLAEAQDERQRLRLRAESLCEAVRQGLNTALADVEEIEIGRAAQQMDDLVAAMGELAAVGLRIDRLQRELG